MEFIKLGTIFPGVGTRPRLWITKAIVEMHVGEIWFTSTDIYGEGSLFSFMMPVQREDGIWLKSWL